MKHIINIESRNQITNQVMTETAQKGIVQLSTQDKVLDGRQITVKGKKLISFGSCSYLGLETHPALKEASKEAAENYGTQFSSSRAYVSLGLYDKLETLLGVMFNAPVMVSASTKLGHLANIPVLVENHDAVILDEQVHASVQMAVQLLKARNITVEIIRHNRMDILEEKVSSLKENHRKIWYMADGVYSMYGDAAPLKEMMELVYLYPQLNLYIDDAHGLSWKGLNGSGMAKTVLPRHEQIFIATSMAKAFGAGGGIMIYPNDDYRRKVRNCGGTMIFSGPIQPPILGACIASAEIHLSNEIYKLQNELEGKINYFIQLAQHLELPLISRNNSPIKFIGVGKPGIGYSMIRRLMEAGYYANLSVFPSVSYNHTGIRLPLTNHLTFEDIEGLLYTVAEQLPLALNEEKFSIRQINRAFKIAV